MVLCSPSSSGHSPSMLILLVLWLTAPTWHSDAAQDANGLSLILLTRPVRVSCNMKECWSLTWLWRRRWHPTPVLLPGKSHGWRSLVGCSPWGLEESDTTERLHFHFSLSCIGEGNDNPLQCSCLENLRDGGAWWAAVYAVAQSRT